MKLKFRMMFAFVSFASFVLPTKASTCSPAKFNVYDQAGFTCTEVVNGSDITFEDFNVSIVDGSGVSDSSIQVVPLNGGLAFEDGFSASSGQTLDLIIRYTELSLQGFTSDSLAIEGFGQSGNGSVDIAESVCVGALFNGSGICPTNVASLNVFDNAGGVKASDSTLLSANILDIVKDTSIVGPAQVSIIDNVTLTGAAVPEPSAMIPIIIGLTLIFFMWPSKRHKSKA